MEHLMAENGSSDVKQEATSEFQIQKVYLKDVSFESPQSPELFSKNGNWNPDINLQLNTESKTVAENVYEIVLTVTVTATLEDKSTAFLVELKQAGIFVIKGFEQDALGGIVGSHCPSILFPFAREAVADLVAKGGFPQLLLSPINFDALYMQHLEKVKQGMAAPQTAQ